jgi:glutamine amidotransferase
LLTLVTGVVDPYGKRNIIVNGDGFGVAWYCDDEPPEDGACMFKIHTPAWSDSNILNIGRYVKSSVILGHVRAAATGHNPLEPVIVSFQNCHPFKYGRYSFMHNGGIPEFGRIKRDLCEMMSFDFYGRICGSTDSEHIFALFLSLLECPNSAMSAEYLAEKLSETFCKILGLCTKHSVGAACSLNILLTDGNHVVASRFRNSDAEPPSLYYSFGTEYSAERGNFENIRSVRRGGKEVIITSSPLNRSGYMVDCFESPSRACRAVSEVEDIDNWRLIPKNHMLVCTGAFHIPFTHTMYALRIFMLS